MFQNYGQSAACVHCDSHQCSGRRNSCSKHPFASNSPNPDDLVNPFSSMSVSVDAKGSTKPETDEKVAVDVKELNADTATAAAYDVADQKDPGPTAGGVDAAELSGAAPTVDTPNRLATANTQFLSKVQSKEYRVPRRPERKSQWKLEKTSVCQVVMSAVSGDTLENNSDGTRGDVVIVLNEPVNSSHLAFATGKAVLCDTYIALRKGIPAQLQPYTVVMDANPLVGTASTGSSLNDSLNDGVEDASIAWEVVCHSLDRILTIKPKVLWVMGKPAQSLFHKWLKKAKLKLASNVITFDGHQCRCYSTSHPSSGGYSGSTKDPVAEMAVTSKLIAKDLGLSSDTDSKKKPHVVVKKPKAAQKTIVVNQVVQSSKTSGPPVALVMKSVATKKTAKITIKSSSKESAAAATETRPNATSAGAAAKDPPPAAAKGPPATKSKK